MDTSVLFMPDYGESNPYQQRLRAGIDAHGVPVSLDSGEGLFPIVTAVRKHGLPDVVHLHWLHPYLMGRGPLTTTVKGTRLILELLVVKLLGVTVVWTIHNLLEHERRAPRIEATFKHAVLRLVDGGIVHCESGRDAVLGSYHLPSWMESKLSVIPHGHYIDWYASDHSREGCRRDLGIDDDVTVFLFFGRIERYKNVPALVDAFRSIPGDAMRLLLVGQPGDEKQAQELASVCNTDERIRTVFEYVPDERVQVYLNAADVVVLPYRDVLSSGAAVLAASFGRAVIAPHRGCIGERFYTESGLIYEPTKERLADVLGRVGEVDLDRVGALNRDRVATPNWSYIAKATLTVYGIDTARDRSETQ